MPTRRPGGLQDLGDGKYRISLDNGLDANGKRRRVTETFHGSKKDAEKRVRELLTLAERGGLEAERKMSVAEYLEKWLRDYAGSLAPLTHNR